MGLGMGFFLGWCFLAGGFLGCFFEGLPLKTTSPSSPAELKAGWLDSPPEDGLECEGDFPLFPPSGALLFWLPEFLMRASVETRVASAEEVVNVLVRLDIAGPKIFPRSCAR